jgi:YD repeat-containing protein
VSRNNRADPAASTRAAVLLRDIVISNLPSPYYHFEYDAAGRVVTASFASGLTDYEVVYDRGGRITEMRNTAVNRDRLAYIYDKRRRVSAILYADSSGAVYTRLSLTYDGQRLTRAGAAAGRRWRLRPRQDDVTLVLR